MARLERILLGIAGGLALVGAGEYWRRRYPVYSQALVGGGVAILYLTVFAAFAFYDLIATYPAIGVLAFISVGAAALALRHESTSLAILGIVGAYLAPFLIGGLDETTGQGAGGSGTSYEVVAYTLLGQRRRCRAVPRSATGAGSRCSRSSRLSRRSWRGSTTRSRT